MAERAGAGAAPYAAEHRRLLTAVRDGRIGPGREHSVVELAAAADLTLEQVRAALVRLEYQGLVRRVTPDAVVVTQLRPEDWATAGQALALFVETSVRNTVPHLAEDEVDAYRTLVTAATDAIRLRSDTVGPDVLATLEFWGDHGRLPLLNRFVWGSLELHRYGLEALPPWQEWDTSGWLTASLHAATTRDPEAAQLAGHLLQDSWQRQEAASARFLGLPADGLRPPRGHGDPADTERSGPAAPLVASERGDERWWTLLGALRDGAFARDVVHTLDEVAAVTGQSEHDLRLAVRQLDAMGLIALQPGARSPFTVRTPTLDDWADTVEMLVGVAEAGLRLLVPSRAPDDVAVGRAHAALVRRYAVSRDPRITVALTDMVRFIVDRTPNRFVRDALLVCLSRTFLVLEPAPTFRRWDLDVFLRRFEDALEHGDPDAASEAGHALARIADAHIADVRAERAVAEDTAAERAAAERARMDG